MPGRLERLERGVAVDRTEREFERLTARGPPSPLPLTVVASRASTITIRPSWRRKHATIDSETSAELEDPSPVRIALFITCFNDTLAPEVGQAVVRLLRRLGHQVEFPAAQTCCGQLHFNTGYREECVPLVRRFADAFAGYDVVVTPSPSCAVMVRDQQPVVAQMAADRGLDPTLPDAVAAVSPRVLELTEFLVDVLGVTDVGASFPRRVAFHPTCHSVRLLHIGDRPRRLLGDVRGLTLLDLPDADQCCGFGGTFAVKNAETSLAMGADKIAAIASTGAEVLTAADTSCLLHLGGMLSRAGSPVRVMHLAEILASQEAVP